MALTADSFEVNKVLNKGDASLSEEEGPPSIGSDDRRHEPNLPMGEGWKGKAFPSGLGPPFLLVSAVAVVVAVALGRNNQERYLVV